MSKFILLSNRVQGHFWAQSVETLVFPSPTGYMLNLSVFVCLIGVYSIHSCKVMGNLPEALNFNQLFLKLNGFMCNQQPVLPLHCWVRYVSRPYVVTLLDQVRTYIFEWWSMARLVLKIINDTHSWSKSHHHLGGFMWSFNEKENRYLRD